MSPQQIVSLSDVHLPAISALEVVSFSPPWSHAQLCEELGVPGGLALGLTEDDRLLGYALLRQLGKEAELLRIAILPECRRSGFGRLLLRAAQDRLTAAGCQQLFLEVRRSNAAARALYADLGFTEVGQRPGYYRQPVEDALVLMLILC